MARRSGPVADERGTFANVTVSNDANLVEPGFLITSISWTPLRSASCCVPVLDEHALDDFARWAG